MNPEAKALDYHDVLLRQGDVQLLAGPHWLNDQERARQGQGCIHSPASCHRAACCAILCTPTHSCAAAWMQVIAFFFEYLQREAFAAAGVLLVSGDSTYLLANLGEGHADPLLLPLLLQSGSRH